MNYIYDILINFQPQLFDIFDWNIDDYITHIRKIPLFKVETPQLLDIAKNQIKFENELLDLINNKTECFNYKKISKIDYACLLSDGNEVIAIKLNKDGKVIEKSFLLFAEAEEVIEYLDDMKIDSFKYEILKKDKTLIYKTRTEDKIGSYVEKKLKNAIDNDSERLKYLYFEYFGRQSDDLKQIFIDLKYHLKNNFDNIYPKIHAIFKMKTNK